MAEVELPSTAVTISRDQAVGNCQKKRFNRQGPNDDRKARTYAKVSPGVLFDLLQRTTGTSRVYAKEMMRSMSK